MGDQEKLDNQSEAERDAATQKPGGLGGDGTIPPNRSGIAAGHTGEATHFEPEEDDRADG